MMRIRFAGFVAALFSCSALFFGCAADTGVGSQETNQGTVSQACMSCRDELLGPINTPADDSVHCAVNQSTCDRTGTCLCSVPVPYTQEWEQALGIYEWWFWTGQLTSDDGRSFGLLENLNLGLDLDTGVPAQWTSQAFADLDRKQFYSNREARVGAQTYVPNGFLFDLKTAQYKGGDGHDRLHGVIKQRGKKITVDLELRSRKTPVLQRADVLGQNGVRSVLGSAIQDGEVPLVYYYSRERMSAEGTVAINGAVHHVRGTFWFDHQFGYQRLAFQNIGLGNGSWGWWALNLNDGRELMVYDVRLPANDPLYPGGIRDGTLISAQCGVTRLSDIEITPLGSWTSLPDDPSLSCEYAMDWRIQVPSVGIDVVVQPFFSAQEVVYPEGPDDLDHGKIMVGERTWEGHAIVLKPVDYQKGVPNTRRAIGIASIEQLGVCVVPVVN